MTKNTISELFESEFKAIRNPYAVALLAAAGTFAFCLQHYAQYAGSPGWQYEIGSSMSIRWVMVNGISLFLFARIAGFPGLIAKSYISVIVAANLTSIIYFGSRLTYGAIESGFETNVNELEGLYVLVGLTPVLIFLVVFTFLLLCGRKVSKTGRIGILLLFLTLLIIPVKLAEQYLTGSKSMAFLRWQRWPIAGTDLYFQDLALGSDLVSAAAYEVDKFRMARDSATSRVLPPGVTLDSAHAVLAPLKVILIVGESSARSHYAAYGYRYPADPHLQEAAKDVDHTLIVGNAMSPAPLTREALVRTLSFASPHDDGPFRDNVNLVELAKLAGYETAWISNQAKIGRHDSPIGMVASTADRVSFQKHDTSGTYRGGHDVDLLAVLDRTYLPDDSKQFIVLHLIGSHESYADRSDPIDYAASADFAPEFRLYDASIHQTDRVIQGAIDKIRGNERALVVYFSDHGEIVNVGHGRLEFIRTQYEIPLVVHGGTQLVRRADESIRKYSAHDMDLFNTTNLSYVFAELLGYSVDETAEHHAISEASYFFNVDNQTYSMNQLH
jgi:heptose-I-phosphate ethanolaminephosphotransferase